MAYQRKFGASVDKNSYSSPSPNNNNSFVISDHSKNNLLTVPTRSRYRRYSLADTMPITSAVNTNVSTKIDCKSPGYSSRVVQYNEHQAKSLQFHQSKYDKMGVFPIVHFFKKDLPYLRRKSNEVNSQTNSFTLTKYNSPEHNQMLLEKIIRSSSEIQSAPHKNEGNTKSVLDALKEISRKRIHSSGEEFILNEDGKRIHVDYDNESSSRKRLKQNSQVENSIIVNPSSKFGLVDELMASHSSMNECFNDDTKPDTANFQPKLSAIPPKLVDVETQTTLQINPPSQSLDLEKPQDQNLNLKNMQQENKSKKTSPVKIFDETPLETMRKNRLTVLMGSLPSNKIHHANIDDTIKSADGFIHTKPLVSILSSPTKSPHKSSKHVTFDIPETSNSSNIVNSTDVYMTLNNSYSSKSGDGSHMVTKTSAAMIMPIISASVSESHPSRVVNKTPTLSSYSTTAFGGQILSNESTAIQISMPSSYLNTKLEEKNVEHTTEKNGGIKETAGKSLAEIPSIATQSSAIGSQNAGFKFELKESQAAPEISTISAPFTFITSASSTSTTTYLSEFSTPNTTTINRFASVTIPSNSSNKGTATVLSANVGKHSNVMPFSSNKKHTDLNGAVASSNFAGTPTSVSNAFSQPVVPSVIQNSSVSCIGNNNSSSSFVITSTASKTSPFTFGSTSTRPTIVGSNFVSPSISSMSTKSSSFPPTFVSQSSFGVQQNIASTSSTFDKPIDFAVSSAALTNSSQPLPKSSTNTFLFDSSKTSSFNKASMLNNNTASFGSDGPAKSNVAQDRVPFFGVSTSSFGTNNATPTTNSVANVGNNIFGNVSSFATHTSSFGSSNFTTFGNSNFGQSPKPGFTGDVKNSSTLSFETPYNTAFDSTPTSPGFGSNVANLSVTPTTFTSSGNFAQTNNAFSSTFRTTSSYDKLAGIAVPNTEILPFGATSSSFGSNSFSANPQVSQNSAFAFGTNVTSKPTVFSFGSNEASKSFNFQVENNSNAFSPNNKNFGSTPPSFNTSSTPFGVQPSGTTMFNIGTGGSSTANRSRTQHKAKRRT